MRFSRIFGFAVLTVLSFLSFDTYGAEPVFQSLEQVTWGPAHPALLPGATGAVLSGDPSKDGPFVLVVKFPAKYQVAAHSHPKDENVTVLSGTLYMGMGDKLDTSAGKPLKSGGYALMPANMNHYVYTVEETVFYVHGQGPVDFKYVNPADDPRNKK